MYKSTRTDDGQVTASQAILRGFPEDGGLYVPTKIPKLEKSLADLAAMDYSGVAYEVMRLFLTDYTEDELKACIRGAYDSKFDTPQIAPLRKAGDPWYLELFHGPTIAFKDMALSILPYLMTTAAKKNGSGNEYMVYVFVEDPKITTAGFEPNKSNTKYSVKLKKGEMLNIGFAQLYQDVIFKSSKGEIAFADEYGNIRAQKAGKSKLTAKINKKTITINVTVE